MYQSLWVLRERSWWEWRVWIKPCRRNWHPNRRLPPWTWLIHCWFGLESPAPCKWPVHTKCSWSTCSCPRYYCRDWVLLFSPLPLGFILVPLAVLFIFISARTVHRRAHPQSGRFFRREAGLWLWLGFLRGLTTLWPCTYFESNWLLSSTSNLSPHPASQSGWTTLHSPPSNIISASQPAPQPRIRSPRSPPPLSPFSLLSAFSPLETHCINSHLSLNPLNTSQCHHTSLSLYSKTAQTPMVQHNSKNIRSSIYL